MFYLLTILGRVIFSALDDIEPGLLFNVCVKAEPLGSSKTLAFLRSINVLKSKSYLELITSSILSPKLAIGFSIVCSPCISSDSL